MVLVGKLVFVDEIDHGSAHWCSYETSKCECKGARDMSGFLLSFKNAEIFFFAVKFFYCVFL